MVGERWVIHIEIRVNQKFKELIPPLTTDERKQLEENILKDGIRDPLVVWGGTLVDGHNRYEIARKHGLEYRMVEKEFRDEDEATLWIIDNQFGRRNLPDVDRIMLSQKRSGVLAEMAKKRQLSTLKQNQEPRTDRFIKNDKSANLTGRDVNIQQKPAPINKTMTEEEPKKQPIPTPVSAPASVPKPTPKPKPVHVQAEIAKMAGVSQGKVAQFEQIQKKKPELIKEIREGNMTIGGAYKEVKRQEKAAAQESKREENYEKVEKLESPLDAQGLFQTIVIDPPWDWGDEGDVNQFGRAKPEYHTMPISEIEGMPINKIADDNCHLYLWVTNRSLPKAFRLIEAWGFRYITCLTWVKPSIGMGNYFRGSTEQVLFAVKGSQMLKRRDVGTHFEAKRGDGHSAKPDEFYSLVESCSYGPYIDVFGRKERDGWTVWGENS